MNETIKLLRLVGSPFAYEREKPKTDEIAHLYECAVKNKAQLLFLDALNENNLLGFLQEDYEIQCKRYIEFLNAVSMVDQLLNKTDIKYAIVKTVRPYRAIPNDIDVLVLSGNKYYHESINILTQAGYKTPITGSATSGPRTDILQEPKTGFPIDLQKEMGASHLVYFNKDGLTGHLKRITLNNGQGFQTINQEADLAIIVGHSLIAEQLYTLAEYYTTLYYLREMNSEQLKRFISVVRKNRLVFAVKTHFTITAALHEEAHGQRVAKLDRILDELGVNYSEVRNVASDGFRMPYRFRLPTVLRVLVEKTREGRARQSIARQLLSFVMEPRVTRTFIKDIVWRRTRETY